MALELALGVGLAEEDAPALAEVLIIEGELLGSREC